MKRKIYGPIKKKKKKKLTSILLKNEQFK